MADALAKMKEEMDRKRKLREESSAAGSEGGGPKKKVYLTKGQLKQLDEKKASGVGAADAVNGADDEALSDSPKKNGSGDAGGGVAKKYIPAHEVVRRLRELKQPIRTFGETDEARMARLRQVEISRPDDDHGGGQKNFMNDRKRAEKEKAAQGGDSSDEEELTPEEKQSKRREKLIRIHIQEEQAEKGEKKEELIKFWIKRVTKEWEIDLEDIPADIKNTVQVRKEITNFHQTKAYLKPLYKQLKKKSLELDILQKLYEIIKMCRARQYIKAADSYLLLSIGKAAWPMGVTMVGIHERSSREKIHSSDVAHILNDETQRKFIQSVKRLMTYCQNKYPPASFTEALEPGCIDTHAPTILKQSGIGDQK